MSGRMAIKSVPAAWIPHETIQDRRRSPTSRSFQPRLARLQTQKDPANAKPFWRMGVARGYFLASPNLPRSVFTNRDSFPLAFISRKIAE